MTTTPKQTAVTRLPTAFEVYVKLIDRKLLARLMAIKQVSTRDLARAAQWKSHSYVGRLLRGEVTTLDPDPAVRIAAYLEVPMDCLFTVRTSTNSGNTVAQNRKAS